MDDQTKEFGKFNKDIDYVRQASSWVMNPEMADKNDANNDEGVKKNDFAKKGNLMDDA